MKTKEDLTEAELACLELYRSHKESESERIFTTLALNVGKKIADKIKPKPKHWSPSKKHYTFDEAKTYLNQLETRAERDCYSCGQADSRLKAEQQLNIINAFMIEANHKSGWVADWGRVRQPKHYVMYDADREEWKFTASYFCRILGLEYTSKEVVEELINLLNDGLIDGVTKP